MCVCARCQPSPTAASPGSPWLSASGPASRKSPPVLETRDYKTYHNRGVLQPVSRIAGRGTWITGFRGRLDPAAHQRASWHCHRPEAAQHSHAGAQVAWLVSRRRSHRPPLPRSCSGRTAKVTLTSRCRWPWRTQRRSLLACCIALLQEITIVCAMPALEVRLGAAAVGGGESSLLASRELGRC